jgi:hypothetical protein
MEWLYIFGAGVTGYFIGYWRWKRISDEAAKVAGEYILIVETHKKRSEKNEQR